VAGNVTVATKSALMGALNLYLDLIMEAVQWAHDRLATNLDRRC